MDFEEKFSVTWMGYGPIVHFDDSNILQFESKEAAKFAFNKLRSTQHHVQRTAFLVRVLNAICYGWTIGTMLWLLFGSR